MHLIRIFIYGDFLLFIMKKQVIPILLFLTLFLIACTPGPQVESAGGIVIVEEEVPEQNTEDRETTQVPVAEETTEEEIEEEPVEEEPILVNGKTTEQRIQEAYDDLHNVGSSQNIRDNFPDIELVYTDNPSNSFYPSEILPFRYYYSKEADKTFNLCNIERTIFICDGKFDYFIDDNTLNSGVCIVTPIYQQS